MATKKSGQGKNHHLEEAIALLIQNQASFLTRVSEMDQRFSKIEERLASIEVWLREHHQVLQEHTRLLEALPETIRQKVGFGPPPEQ